MKCNQIRELLPDLAAGLNAVTPETQEHIRACPACAGKLEDIRKTMALLDEWQALEPSPYFDVRLQARLREEAAQLRGAADSVALRLRYHDDAVHSKRVPSGPLARAVFDAVEQARVEALGSRRMAIYRRSIRITNCTLILMCWTTWKYSRM